MVVGDVVECEAGELGDFRGREAGGGEGVVEEGVEAGGGVVRGGHAGCGSSFLLPLREISKHAPGIRRHALWRVTSRRAISVAAFFHPPFPSTHHHASLAAMTVSSRRTDASHAHPRSSTTPVRRRSPPPRPH